MVRGRRGSLLALVLVAAGAAVLWWSGRGLVHGIASAAWPLVDGRVISSEAVRGSGGRGVFASAGWHPRVVYEYRAGGSRHRGDVIRFGGTIGRSRADAERLVAEYPVGRTVDVRHDPRDPSRAVLVPGLGLEAFAVPLLGTVMLTGGSALLFVARLRGRLARARTQRAAAG